MPGSWLAYAVQVNYAGVPTLKNNIAPHNSNNEITCHNENSIHEYFSYIQIYVHKNTNSENFIV